MPLDFAVCSHSFYMRIFSRIGIYCKTIFCMAIIPSTFNLMLAGLFTSPFLFQICFNTCIQNLLCCFIRNRRWIGCSLNIIGCRFNDNFYTAWHLSSSFVKRFTFGPLLDVQIFRSIFLFHVTFDYSIENQCISTISYPTDSPWSEVWLVYFSNTWWRCKTGSQVMREPKWKVETRWGMKKVHGLRLLGNKIRGKGLTMRMGSYSLSMFDY